MNPFTVFRRWLHSDLMPTAVVCAAVATVVVSLAVFAIAAATA